MKWLHPCQAARLPERIDFRTTLKLAADPHEYVEALSTSKDQSGLNIALRVLSAVEALLNSEPK